MVREDTASASPTVRGPEKKNWLCHSLSLFMSVSMILNMCGTFEYLPLHAAFMADKIGAISMAYGFSTLIVRRDSQIWWCETRNSSFRLNFANKNLIMGALSKLN